MKNAQKEFFPFNNAWGLKRDSFSKKMEWGVIFLLSMDSLKIKIFGYL
jgi:hypothetical protein